MCYPQEGVQTGIMAPAVRGGNRRGVTCEWCLAENQATLPPGSECANTVDKRLRTKTYGKATNKGLTRKAWSRGVVTAENQSSIKLIMRAMKWRKDFFLTG